MALSSCEADKRSWRHCRRHIRGGQGSSLPLTLPGRARSRLHRAHRSRWAWTIKPPSPSSSVARLHNHRHRPPRVVSCLYVIGFVSFDINGTRKGVPTRHTHTNKTAYIRGIYLRVHTHLLIKSLTLGKTTFASNLARRRRKNHGFEPHIGNRELLPFPPFFLPRFVVCFPPFCVAASGVSLPACSLQFFRQSLPFFSPIFPPATRPARLISAFRSFSSAHQSSVYPRYGEHRLRQAAQRFSPCSCLLPRSFCSLSSSLLSRALLLSSDSASLLLCLLLSSSLLISF